MASKSLKYLANAHMLFVQVVNDETGEVERELKLGVDELPDLLANGDEQENLKLYGARKLLQERSSSEKDVEVKFESMLETAQLLRDGKWKSDEVKSRVAQIDAVFAQAVANIKGKPVAAIVPALQALTKEQRDAIRNSGAVAKEIERLKSEAAAAPAEDLLAGLDA